MIMDDYFMQLLQDEEGRVQATARKKKEGRMTEGRRKKMMIMMESL